MELTSENVEAVFLECMFAKEETTDNHIEVEGIINRVGFHPERLASHKEDIRTMLQCLPDQFHSNKGGGWSFLNALQDKNGSQWTDLHQRIEQLFQLGIGLKLAKWQMPRSMWPVLPGGMPYVVILS